VASPPHAPEPLAAAARRLVHARRVLATGLVAATADAARAACDLAEAIAAAVDFGQPDLDRPAGPTIARVGEVTAAPEEMRDRADVVILWGCDPAAADPALTAMVPPRATVVRVPVAGSAAIEAARILLHLVRGGEPPAAGGESVAACVAAHRAIAEATCVAIVTNDADDDLGLGAWSIAHVVREIAHRKPAFEIPARGAAHAIAAAVSTWRYGAAGAIARADRGGGRFLPAEASARRLIERGEVDCVLAIGRLADGVEAAIRGRGDALAVERVAADPQPLGELLTAVRGLLAGGRP
jgi:hypothetical protein